MLHRLAGSLLFQPSLHLLYPRAFAVSLWYYKELQTPSLDQLQTILLSCRQCRRCCRDDLLQSQLAADLKYASRLRYCIDHFLCRAASLLYSILRIERIELIAKSDVLMKGQDQIASRRRCKRTQEKDGEDERT